MNLATSILILGINVISAFLFYYCAQNARERDASKWVVGFYNVLLGVNVGLAGLSLLNLLYTLDHL